MVSRRLGVVGLIGALVLAGCGNEASPPETNNTLRIAATTSIVGDVVEQVGGEHIELTVLMAPGQDPHSYEPVPADFARLQESDLIFSNGLGFEEGLEEQLQSLEGVKVVPLSEEIEAIPGGEYGAGDPHVWQDPVNVKVWAETIAQQLSAADPAHAGDYRANADSYVDQLTALGEEIRAQVAQIPEPDRKLITYHNNLAYFARRYEFEVVGTVLQGSGEASEPSAGELAALIETIRTEEVPAIFIENTIEPRLAQILADEVGGEVQILSLYTDSLGAPGGEADSYLNMMRANTNTIVAGLSSN